MAAMAARFVHQVELRGGADQDLDEDEAARGRQQNENQLIRHQAARDSSRVCHWPRDCSRPPCRQ